MKDGREKSREERGKKEGREENTQTARKVGKLEKTN